MVSDPRVHHIHMTGGKATHDVIVWGPGKSCMYIYAYVCISIVDLIEYSYYQVNNVKIKFFKNQ